MKLLFLSFFILMKKKICVNMVMRTVMMLQTAANIDEEGKYLVARRELCTLQCFSVFDLHENDVIFLQVKNIMVSFQRLELAGFGLGVQT